LPKVGKILCVLDTRDKYDVHWMQRENMMSLNAEEKAHWGIVHRKQRINRACMVCRGKI